MKVAYLVNQYPKVSLSFIRREIAALENYDIRVERFSIRSCKSELVDPADKLEEERTRVVLVQGVLNLMLNLLIVTITRPVYLLKALLLVFRIGWRSRNGILKHLVYLAEACVLFRQFHDLKVDHVHAHFGTNSTTVAMLCHLLGGPPYSFTAHGPEEFDYAQSIALTEKIRRATFVVAVSCFGKSQLYRWCDQDQWQKIHAIRCGVDSSFLKAAIKDLPDSPQLVFVGRLCEQKGLPILLHAAGHLSAEGLQFQLTIVGDGQLKPQVEALIEHYGLEERVKITGWASSSEVNQHIINSRILVLPSFAEGLPVVIMEALALGRPVISTYTAGIPELVKPGANGWLVPPGSVEELTTAMRQALHLPKEQLQQMGQAGAAAVAQLHNLNVEAAKLAALFLEEGPNQKAEVKRERVDVPPLSSVKELATNQVAE